MTYRTGLDLVDREFAAFDADDYRELTKVRLSAGPAAYRARRDSLLEQREREGRDLTADDGGARAAFIARMDALGRDPIAPDLASSLHRMLESQRPRSPLTDEERAEISAADARADFERRMFALGTDPIGGHRG